MKATPLILSLLTFLCVLPTQIFAATFLVNQTGDGGDLTCDATCTLRDAIDDANAAATDDVIIFASNVSTVTLTNEIVINNRGRLAIRGNGADTFTIDGGAGQNRIFFINNATVSLANLTLTGGNGAGVAFNLNGGAIYALRGSLTFNRVHVTGNTATTGGPAAGIFFFEGTHRILNTTFSNNVTTTSCAGFYNSGGNITIVNSTFYRNSAKTGGAFCNQGNITMRHATVSGNTGSLGGGAFYQDSNSNFTFGNTIIAGNFADSGAPEITFQAGTIRSEGNNIVGDLSGDAANTRNPISYRASDILDRAPLLGAFALFGGAAPTLELLNGSPAIDAGNNSLAVDPSNNNFGLTTDQRFYRRTVDGDGDGTTAVDIGAFEYNSTAATSANIAGRATARNKGVARVIITLRSSDGQTIAIAVTNPFGFYRFLNVPLGDGYTLTATSKQFVFAAQTAAVFGDGDDFNFAAQ